jgi:hypothetical protein
LAKKSSIPGTILAMIGMIIPSFIFFWTGAQTVSLILAGGYFFLWGYGEISLWIFSENDSALHIFNLNWYLNPSNLSQGSDGMDGILEVLAVAMYSGNFGNSELDISGILFGISFLLICFGLILGLLMKYEPKFSGLLFILGSVIALISLFLTWINITNLSLIGSGVEENFLPLPLGSLVILGAGIWNLRQG